MADTSIIFTRVAGPAMPIKCHDNGDGSFSIVTATSHQGGSDVTMSFIDVAGSIIPIRLYDLGDGTYALGIV